MPSSGLPPWRLSAVLALSLGAIVASLCALALTAALCLRSDGGQAWLARRAERFATERLHGSLHIGSLSGSLLHDLTVEDVALLDERGAPVVAVRRVRLDLGVGRVLSRRPRIDRITVEGALVDADALADDRLRLGPLVDTLRSHVEHFSVEELALDDVSLRLGGRTGPLTRVDGLTARASIAADSDGNSGLVTLRSLELRALLDGKRATLSAAGTVRWDHGALEARDVLVRTGDSRVGGWFALAPDRVALAITDLVVTPRDLHRFVAMEELPATVRGHISARGPLHAIATTIDVRGGATHVHLRGTLDVPRRHLTATVDHDHLDGAFFPTRPPFVITARARLSLHLGSDGGITGTARLTDASGTIEDVAFERAAAEARFVGQGVDFDRASLDVPGATVKATAHIVFAKGLRAEFHAHVTDAGKLLSLVRGHKGEAPSPPQLSSLVTVDGVITQKKGERPKLELKGLGANRAVPRAPDGSAR